MPEVGGRPQIAGRLALLDREPVVGSFEDHGPRHAVAADHELAATTDLSGVTHPFDERVDGVAGRTVPIVQSWAPVASGTVLWLFAWTAFTQGRRRAPARL